MRLALQIGSDAVSKGDESIKFVRAGRGDRIRIQVGRQRGIFSGGMVLSVIDANTQCRRNQARR